MWKVVLGILLVVLGALGVSLLLIAVGAIQPDVQRKEPSLLQLPETVSKANICAMDDYGDRCWIEVMNQPGCYVWLAWHRPLHEVLWFGECAEGLAEGTGKWLEGRRVRLLMASWLSRPSIEEGLLVRGRKQGDWQARFRDGRVDTVSYLDGLPHGVWLTRYADGNTRETRYLLGKSYGYPIVSGPDGEPRESNPFAKTKIDEGPVNTDKHGIWRRQDPDARPQELVLVDSLELKAWGLSGSDKPLKETPFPRRELTGDFVLRLAGGTEAEGLIVDGEMHGEWTFRSPGGNVARGLYVDNSRSGDWIETHVDGTVGQGPYRGNLRHGEWEFRYANGMVQEGAFSNGRKSGEWVTNYANGLVATGPYHGRKAHGVWIYRYPNGEAHEGSFVEGKRHGEWTRKFPDGTVQQGMFADDQEYGEWTESYPDGTVMKGPYAAGKRHGRWLVREANGNTFEEHWENGIRAIKAGEQRGGP